MFYEAHADKLRFLVVGAFNTAFGYGLFLGMLFLIEAVLPAAEGTTHGVLGSLRLLPWLRAQLRNPLAHRQRVGLHTADRSACGNRCRCSVQLYRPQTLHLCHDGLSVSSRASVRSLETLVRRVAEILLFPCPDPRCTGACSARIPMQLSNTLGGAAARNAQPPDVSCGTPTKPQE